ncbi:hypothetical protein D3C80_1053710 [compost metagenome]
MGAETPDDSGLGAPIGVTAQEEEAHIILVQVQGTRNDDGLSVLIYRKGGKQRLDLVLDLAGQGRTAIELRSPGLGLAAAVDHREGPAVGLADPDIPACCQLKRRRRHGSTLVIRAPTHRLLAVASDGAECRSCRNDRLCPTIADNLQQFVRGDITAFGGRAPGRQLTVAANGTEDKGRGNYPLDNHAVEYRPDMGWDFATVSRIAPGMDLTAYRTHGKGILGGVNRRGGIVQQLMQHCYGHRRTRVVGPSHRTDPIICSGGVTVNECEGTAITVHRVNIAQGRQHCRHVVPPHQ